MELKRIIRGEGDEEAAREKLWEGVAMVVDEEGVVAERGHGDADLRQVEEVLEHRGLCGTQVRETRVGFCGYKPP